MTLVSQLQSLLGHDAVLTSRADTAAYVEDWRGRWGQGDFPFAWVQLPGWKPGNNEGWPAVREAMLQTLSVPNTGMAITMSSPCPLDSTTKIQAAPATRRRMADASAVVRSRTSTGS